MTIEHLTLVVAAAAIPRSAAKSPARDSDLGYLKCDVATVAHHLRTDLDQLLLQARQRAQETAEILGQRMKLEPDGVGGERPARQPRPLGRAFTFFDPLLAHPAFVVERHGPLGRARQVGDTDSTTMKSASSTRLSTKKSLDP